MIDDRLKVIVNIYMAKYDELTKEEHDVRDKWAAVSSCVKKWAPDADDFETMFDAAMKKAGFLLEHGDAHPLEGIRFLCRNGKKEEVRRAFEDLMQRDNGEIDDRQVRVQRFLETVNGMLDELAPMEWHYKQRTRTVIKYMALIRPQEHYFLRASAAAAFAGYTDFDDEIGYDKFLRLRNYYHMCDELVEYLHTREDLQQLVLNALEEKGKQIGDADIAHIDPAMHVLAFDIIDSAYRYDFYSDKSANRKSKISTVAKRKIDRMQNKASLIDEREDVVDLFDEIDDLDKSSHIPDLAGMKTVHAAYGEGVITEQDGRYLTVEFEGLKKKFALPAAILKGYLSFEDESILQKCRDMEALHEKRRALEAKLTSIDVQLQLLE